MQNMDKYSIFDMATIQIHSRVIADYYKINPANSDERRELQNLLEMKYGVIKTPDLLYEKHVIREFDRNSALNLSPTANCSFSW